MFQMVSPRPRLRRALPLRRRHLRPHAHPRDRRLWRPREPDAALRGRLHGLHHGECRPARHLGLRRRVPDARSAPSASNPWVAFFATTGVILSAAYALWLYRRVVFGVLEKPRARRHPGSRPRARSRSSRRSSLLVIYYGVQPGPILDSLRRLDRRARQELPGGARRPSRPPPLGRSLRLAMNPAFAVPAFGPALPEIILAVGALVLVLVGAFRGERSSDARQRRRARAARASRSSPCCCCPPARRVDASDGSFVVDAFAKFMKVADADRRRPPASSCRPTTCAARASTASSSRS